MKFRVLDEIAFEASREGAKPKFKTAHRGEIVELTEKDAAALKRRGAVVELKE